MRKRQRHILLRDVIDNVIFFSFFLTTAHKSMWYVQNEGLTVNPLMEYRKLKSARLFALKVRFGT